MSETKNPITDAQLIEAREYLRTLYDEQKEKRNAAYEVYNELCSATSDTTAELNAVVTLCRQRCLPDKPTPPAVATYRLPVVSPGRTDDDDNTDPFSDDE